MPEKQQKTISIIGATGSIGRTTIELLKHSELKFKVKTLTANSNYKKLASYARELQAESVVIAEDKFYNDLKEELAGSGIKVAAGQNAIIEAASQKVDLLVSAMVGAAGLKPTLAAVRQGTTIAFANKECLVCAGDLFINEVNKYGAKLLPVDSEHNAIFQVFEMENKEAVSKLILTASGGPFRDMTYEEMRFVTPKQALSHPNWDMGAKISIDSATMVNKGLEIIEAYHLFPVAKDQIEVIIHPESIIHSMVEYVDGSVLAQMAMPDMTMPISYALSYPKRMETRQRKLSFADIGRLTFRNVDSKRFPAIDIAFAVLNEGGSAPIIFNAANEIAVANFLGQRISFVEIIELINETLASCERFDIDNIDDVYNTINYAQQQAQEIAMQFIRRVA